MLYFLATLILGYFFLKETWTRWNYDLHKIPAPPKLPFLGHALQLKKGHKMRAINLWVQDWRAKLGFPKLMRFCIAGKTMVVVADLDLVRTIAQPKSGTIPKSGPLYERLHRVFMGNDPTLSFLTIKEATPYVKAIRRCYAESFSSAGLRDVFSKQVESFKKGIVYLEKRKQDVAVDIQEFFSRLSLDSAGTAEADVDLGALDNSGRLYRVLFDCSYHASALSTVPFYELQTKLFPNSKLAQRVNKDFDDLFEEWTKIANQVYKRGEPDNKDLSFAANLKRVRIPGTDDPLPFNLFRGELATALAAGFDTSSQQLSWTLAFLAANPSVVDKLIDELRSHGLFGDGARDLKFEDLTELEYLNATINEGMRRIHVPIFVSARAASRDLVLDGYRIPTGTQLLSCSNLCMNCEMEWEDHLAFKPERWLNGNINTKEKYYLPFGLGERDCIGKKFAVQSMRVGLFYFVTRFSFELVGETIDSLVENGSTRVIFEADHGINMKISPRKQ
eukprot:g348.t1